MNKVLKYILIGLFTGVLLNTTYAILAPTILFVLSLIDKVGKKKSLLIFLIIGLTSIGTFFAYQALNNAFDITRYLNQKQIEKKFDKMYKEN